MNLRSLVSSLGVAVGGVALLLVGGACGDGDDAAGPGPGGGPSSSDGSGASTADGGSGPGGTGGDGGSGAGAGDTCIEDPSLCGGDRPVCAPDGRCVECTPQDRAQCTGDELTCDELTNTCGPCRYHAQCPGAACNVFTGLCMTAPPVSVGLGAGDDFARIDLAVDAIPNQGEGIIIVDDKGSAYENTVSVADGKVVAILAGSGRPVIDVPIIGAPFPGIQVNSNATLMVEGLTFEGNSYGLEIFDGNVNLDRVEIRDGVSGGILADATTELRVRTSTLGANGSFTASGFSAIAVGPDVTLDVNFSTIVGLSSGSPAISCEEGAVVTVRNAILFAGTSGLNSPLAMCDAGVALTVTNTVASTMLPGTGNATFIPSSGFFEDLSRGDLRLTPAGRAEFADHARWADFDPRVDLDGRPRPNLVDGSFDVAGAHLGP
ncbi:MAG: hypothetical protein AAF715_31700 [Myxococcota bacterium]